MGLVDAIQQRAERSAAARQGRQANGQGKKPRASKRAPAPPLDQLERRIGYVMGVVAAVAFVAIWVPHLGEVVTKKQASPTSELAFGLIAAALLGWSTVIKRRWVLAFAAFYVGLAGPWGSYRYVGYAMMAVGAWLLFRNAKLQGDAQKAANAAGARSPGRASSGSRSRSAGRSTSGSSAASGKRAAYATKPSAGSPRSTRGAGAKRQAPARARAAKTAKGATADAGRAVPAASKRYTPAQAGDRKERRQRRESVRSGAGNSGSAGSGAANRSASPKV